MTKEKISGIYKITNIINDRFYIGSTVDLIRRKQTHFNLLTNNKHENKFLQNDFNKCGIDSFIFEIIENIKEHTTLLLIEQKHLDQYWDNKNSCYNICQIAGPGPALFGEDNPFFGRTHTDESKKIIGEKSKLKIISEECKKENSLRTTGVGNPNYGKKHSNETKEKMKLTRENNPNKYIISKKISETMKLVWINKDYEKKVEQLSLDGKIIAEHDSTTSASEKTGIPRRGITSSIKGTRRTSFGFIWRYKK